MEQELWTIYKNSIVTNPDTGLRIRGDPFTKLPLVTMSGNNMGNLDAWLRTVTVFIIIPSNTSARQGGFPPCKGGWRIRQPKVNNVLHIPCVAWWVRAHIVGQGALALHPTCGVTQHFGCSNSASLCVCFPIWVREHIGLFVRMFSVLSELKLVLSTGSEREPTFLKCWS